MSNWNNAGRYHGGFPPSVHRQAKRNLDNHCAQCGDNQCRLWLDHIVPAAEGGTDTIDNAQWLCTPCHDLKTKAEAARGRARHNARGKASTEHHPGLLDPT